MSFIISDSMTNTEHSPDSAFSVGDTTDYIATLSKELAELARAQRLDFLAFLLEMAATEALNPSTNITMKLPIPAIPAKKAALKNGKKAKSH